MLRKRLPASDTWHELGHILAHFAIDADRWLALSHWARTFHTAWWREHNLRQSIERRAGREVAEIMSKRKPGPANRSTFFEQWQRK